MRCDQVSFRRSTLMTPGEIRVISMSAIQLSGDDVERPEDGDGVGNGLPHDDLRVGLEDGEAGRPAADAVGILRPVRDEVEAELAVAPLDLEVRLADRRLDAVHDQL